MSRPTDLPSKYLVIAAIVAVLVLLIATQGCAQTERPGCGGGYEPAYWTGSQWVACA